MPASFAEARPDVNPQTLAEQPCAVFYSEFLSCMSKGRQNPARHALRPRLRRSSARFSFRLRTGRFSVM